MILRMSSYRVYLFAISLSLIVLLYLHYGAKGKIVRVELPPKVQLILAEQDSKCIEHHIVIVVGGYTTCYNALPLFKSILHHHRGPLVFHFITDQQSRQVLPTMFGTWELPSVRYQIYDMEPYKKQVEWVPNKHYSSIYGLIRLAIPDMLSKDVKEVLFLDIDLVVLNDISPIFNAFKGSNESVLLAMAENISPGYTWGRNKWPARGRGFNAGVSLLHLERMRRANWTEMWTREAKETFEKDVHKGNDQDIINALTVSHPHIAVELPCAYNYQLGSLATPLECQRSERFVKIAHFNSPEKLRLKSKYSVYFTRYHLIYQAMDGYVFRQREQCDGDIESSSSLADLTEVDRECDELAVAIQTTYRTQLYFNGFETSTEPNDITLVTHLSVDRFAVFQRLLEYWEGPISAAIYCTDAELAQIEKTIQSFARNRTNVALHAVFKTGSYYPANYLRNVALNAASTEFAYLADVDFMPSKELYDTLRSATRNTNMTNRALLIPAFELTSASDSNQIPSTKEELLNAWDEGKIRPLENDSAMQNQSIYEIWRNSASSYEVDVNSEPKSFAVVARKSVPRFEERLIGSGWRDNIYYSTLQEDGIKFETVPGAFTVRHFQPSSTMVNDVPSPYRKCMHIFRNEFASDPKLEKIIRKAVAVTS